MRTIVLSAINLRSGGTFTILRDCLHFLNDSNLSKHFRIIAFVHCKKDLDYPNIEFVEIKDSVGNYLKRLYYEYYYFHKISKKLNPYIWFSLHDMSPNVVADKRIVYMHNALMTHKIDKTTLRFGKKYIPWILLYKFLYKINIKKNDYCVVQQNWFRKKINTELNIPIDKIIAAVPKSDKPVKLNTKKIKNTFTVFYPSFPRAFKNFETLCEAALIIENQGINNIEILITIKGDENKYAKWLFEKYGHIKTIKFIGEIPNKEINRFYSQADCLVFLSKLESWGLPISEFMIYDKPMILVNKDYAKEASTGAKSALFVEPNDVNMIATEIINLRNNKTDNFKDVKHENLEEPFANNWEELFKIIVDDKK